LALKENAIAAGATGADIYRPTIGFAGAMIFAGGLILIVLFVFRVINGRVQKYGYKINDMEKLGVIAYGRRPKIMGLNRIMHSRDIPRHYIV
jgi:hypothetical protein